MVLDDIRTALAKKSKRETITEDVLLKDLGLDSLDVVEMCLDFEEKYGITFETAELGTLKTVGDLMDTIQKKLVNK